MARGWWTPFRWRGTSFRLHWSLPPAALFLGTGYPARTLAFVLLLTAHELGHAVLVRRFRGDVLAIELTGFVGFCRWQGNFSRHELALIAWGGVLAQSTILAIAMAALTAAPGVHEIQETRVILVHLNLAMIVFNLVPVPPLDGALAWRALPGMFQRRQRLSPKALPRRGGDHLRVVDDDDDDPSSTMH